MASSEGTARAARAGQDTSLQQPPEQALNCPRCDSPNTKFCYYNNYSLSQPRHFCKTCRRYWTRGGALRNVPVGGGSRKNKKSKASVLSRLPLVNCDSGVGGFSDPGVSLQNLLSGPSQLVPAASDFQLGVLPFSRIHSPSTYNMPNTSNNKYISINGDQIIPSHSSAFSPTNISTPYGNKINVPSSSSSVDTGIASSIESLSFINQDLHLKLQQQRMSMIFAKETTDQTSMAPNESLEGHAGPISSDFGETSGLQRGWYVDNSFAVPAGTGTGGNASILANDNCNGNNISSNGNNSSYNWSGIGSSGWNEMPQFTAMP